MAATMARMLLPRFLRVLSPGRVTHTTAIYETSGGLDDASNMRGAAPLQRHVGGRPERRGAPRPLRSRTRAGRLNETRVESGGRRPSVPGCVRDHRRLTRHPGGVRRRAHRLEKIAAPFARNALG